MSEPGAQYYLCPRCFRAVPAAAGERYCPNDGTLLLTRCSGCGAGIGTPYARYCKACGLELGQHPRPVAAPAKVAPDEAAADSPFPAFSQETP